MAVVIGAGTGRCGTVSLSSILDAQEHASVTHEMAPLLPWVPSQSMFDHRISTIRSRGLPVVGDVAFFYLPYLEKALTLHPDLVVVGLIRNQDDVIRSYVRKVGNRNHWSTRGSPCHWDNCYPTYGDIGLEEGIGRFWDEYNSTLEFLSEKTSRVKIWRTEDLNDDKRVEEILDFCRVPRPWTFPEKRRLNRS